MIKMKDGISTSRLLPKLKNILGVVLSMITVLLNLFISMLRNIKRAPWQSFFNLSFPAILFLGFLATVVVLVFVVTAGGRFLYFNGWAHSATTPSLNLAIGLANLGLMLLIAIVLISLVVQIRVTNRKIQAQSDNVLANLKSSALSKSISQLHEINRIFSENMHLFAEPNNENRVKEDSYQGVITTILATFQDVYFQGKVYHLIEDDLWDSWVNVMRTILSMPLSQDYWAKRHDAYPLNFQVFITQIMSEEFSSRGDQ